MQNIIETVALTKTFAQTPNYRRLLRRGRSKDLVAVNAVDLQIRAGELFGLLGPNGAGKTTLLKMLCTLVVPSHGNALIQGKDVVHDATAVKRLIGLVDCQERSFFWRLSGRQNLAFFAALYGLRGAQATNRGDELLALVGLAEHADRRFAGYSSGMRQKLAIARGLLTMPPILFMDEPTRSLDPMSAQDLRRFIRHTLVEELGRTVVLVTHRLAEAEELCDRVAIMHQGHIITSGSSAEIKQRLVPQQIYHLQVQNLSAEGCAGLRVIPGVTQVNQQRVDAQCWHIELTLAKVTQTLPHVIHFLVAQGAAIQQCQAQELSLEQAFVEFVSRSDSCI